jgi:hypothetical protein
MAEVHEPGLAAVELLCERLGELGLPIGPDTAREILRAVLALEAPRMEAHLREALQVSLDTIRVAAQAASGVLESTTPVENRQPAPEVRAPVLERGQARPPAPKPAPAPPPPRRATPTGTPRPSGGRRTPAPRRPPDLDDDFDGERRPVFRRPRR